MDRPIAARHETEAAVSLDQQVRHEAVPAALADIHRGMAVETPLDLQVSGWQPGALADVVLGAGFVIDRLVSEADGQLTMHGRRARTLPDTVGPDMRLLFCGLNPSLYAADAGVGFARPGNRFWPAALAAGLVTADRDPGHALRHHGIGMTDLVKRASTGAAEVSRAAAESRRATAASPSRGVAAIDRRAAAMSDWTDPTAAA